MKLRRLLSLALVSLCGLVGCKKPVPAPAPEPDEPEVVVHTLAEIEEDIAASLSAATGLSLSFADTGYGYDRLGLNFGTDEAYVDDASEEICSASVTTLVSFFPEYLTLVDASFYDGIVTEDMSEEEKEEHDYWGYEDGSTAYVETFVNEDVSAMVWVEGYCYNSKLYGIINATDLSE